MAMQLSEEGPRADLEGAPSAAGPDLPEMPVLGEEVREHADAPC
jgi:hypothetical protein